MKLLVLLNEAVVSMNGSKPDELRRRIADGFSAVNADAEVRVVDPRWLDKHLTEAADGSFDALIAGGGDSMINPLANAFLGLSRKPFGVLPLAVSNYFATDLGFSNDLEENIRALANASIGEFIPGEINGRLFLSYCGVGLDPIAVLPRNARSPLPTDALVFPAPRRHDVHVATRGRTVVPDTPCVIVSNNASQIRAFGLREAAPPEPGLMTAYVARRAKPTSVVGRVLHRLPNRRDPGPPHFQSMTLPEFRIDTPRNRKIILSIDGEMLEVRPPLHIRARATPIRVLTPPRNGTKSGA